MLHWRFWAGRRDRLALALIGVIVLGAGLSVIATLTDSIRGTVARAYEQTWRAPYDILVHVPLPGGTHYPDLAEPNILTTLPPGITRQQLAQVKAVGGVDITAPVAVVGYIFAGPRYAIPSAEIPQPKNGLYRVTSRTTSTDPEAPQEVVVSFLAAFTMRKNETTPTYPAGTMVIDGKRLTGLYGGANIPVLVVALDLEAERRLVGLDGALTAGQYPAADQPLPVVPIAETDGTMTTRPIMPVLVNLQALRSLSYSMTVEELDADLKVNQVLFERFWTPEDMADAMEQGEKDNSGLQARHALLGQPGPITYRGAASPFPDRWPVAVSLEPHTADLESRFPRTEEVQVAFSLGSRYRDWRTPETTMAPEKITEDLTVYYQVKGYFDSAKLDVVKDSGTNMPLMTYRPAEAVRMLDGAGQPLNPPRTMSGGISPVGFLSSPPVFVTTLEAGLSAIGDGAINAIQVKLSGTEHFTPETVARVRRIAQEIEQRTGLVAEVTMGSSPANVLVQAPPANGQPGFGWVEQQWIHKEAGVTTVLQTEFGYSSFVVMVLIVGVIYTVSMALAGVTARRRELGIAVAVGWPSRALARLAMGEQLAFGLAVGLMAALTAAARGAGPGKVATIMAVGVLIYLPAMLASVYATLRTSPGDAIRWGDTAPGRRVLPGTRILALALASLMGRPGRVALTIIAMALPTSLLLVLAFISRHLSGVLYTTITGQYAALRVGPLQYTMGLTALAVAMVTVVDLVHQNAMDHRQERALLFAVGWKRTWIAATVIAEGILLGAAAGILGDLVGVAVLLAMYGPVSAQAWPVALTVWSLPLLLGLLAGVLGSVGELRSWNWAGMAGVKSSQVMRYGWGTAVAGAVSVLLVVGATAGLVLPRLTATLDAGATTPALSAGDMAVTAIEREVARQHEALARGDVDAFLSTFDANAGAYLAQQRHFAQELKAWKERTPGGTVKRSVARVSLLGENTALVHISQVVGAAPAAEVETVWTRSGTQWYEHGPNRKVLESGEVVVWYPAGLPEARASEMAENARKAMARVRAAGWPVSGPLLVDKAGDEARLRRFLRTGVANPKILDPVWTEFGEPLTVLSERLPMELTFAQALVQRSVMEQSHNRVAEWLRYGITYRFLLTQTGGSVADLKAETAADVSLATVSTLHPDDPSGVDGGKLNTATLFVEFIEQTYGPRTVPAVLAILAQAPPDPGRAGPDVWADRDRDTIKAMEQVTGRTWAQLGTTFAAWCAKGVGQ